MTIGEKTDICLNIRRYPEVLHIKIGISQNSETNWDILISPTLGSSHSLRATGMFY